MRVTSWVVVVGVAAGLAACSGGGDSGSCAAPVPVVSPDTAAAGDQVTVTIEYGTGCDDTNADDGPAATNRWQHVRLVLTQGNEDTELATADADAQGRLSVTVTVPSTAAAGAATIHADGTGTTTFTVGGS